MSIDAKTSAASLEREFVLWRASGEYFTETGTSLLKVLRRHKIVAEPSAEVVAAMEMKLVVRPSASGLPFMFACLSSSPKK